MTKWLKVITLTLELIESLYEADNMPFSTFDIPAVVVPSMIKDHTYCWLYPKYTSNI